MAEFAQLQREVTEIKSAGSPLYRMHEDRDNERAKNTATHFATLDEIVKIVPALDKKLSIIDLKIDNLSANLEEHKKAMVK